MAKIGLWQGSPRPTGNGVGITAWVQSRLDSLLKDGTTSVIINPSTTDGLSLGPFTSDTIPAAIKDVSQYDSLAVQRWSRTVSSLSALIVVSCQYNWGYPAELKNGIDHLFHEWHGLPIVIVTYGGHGGDKCAAQLRVVFEGGVDAKVVSAGELMFTLPKDNIRSSARVTKDEATQAFLAPYAEKTDDVLAKLVAAAKERHEAKL